MNYKEFFESKKDETKIYALVYKPAEDRGGTNKPAAIIMGDTIEALTIEALEKLARNEVHTLEVRNGALFQNSRLLEGYDYEDGGPTLLQKVANPNATPLLMDVVKKIAEWTKKGGTAETLVKKVIEPDGWWTLIGRGDGEGNEDEEAETPKNFNGVDDGYLVLISEDSSEWRKIFPATKVHEIATTGGSKRELWYFTNFAYCLKIWAGLEQEGSVDQVDIFRIKNGEATLLLSSASVQGAVDFKTTGMSCYDYAYNPYTNCSFGCKYCFAEKGGIKDFRCLPADLKDRICIGSTTDPYQPAEAEKKLTKFTLERLLTLQDVKKVGIFTKSPLVCRDLDLIKKLPNPVIHLNVSPFKEETRKMLEPNAPTNSERLEAAKKIKEAGIKLVINFCPCMPEISTTEGFDEFFELADEICIGLTMMYAGIPESLSTVLPESVVKTMTEKNRVPWELGFMLKAQKDMKKWSGKKLVIWRDTGRKGWKNLDDLTLIPQEFYSV